MASAAFPKIGDVFSSVTAFKLACHRAALASSFDMKALSATDRHAKMSCRNRTGTTTAKIGSGEHCTFRLRAYSTGKRDGSVKVVKAVMQHSCTAALRAARAEQAVAFGGNKIRQLEEEKQPRRRRKAAPVEQGEREERTDEDVESSSVDEETASEGEATDTVDERVEEEPYPSAWALRSEVTAVAQAGPVALPACTTTFSSARALLVHLHAFAQQRHFTLYRKSRANDSNRLNLVCTRNHSRCDEAENGRCSCSIEAKKAADGSWRVIRSTLTHNHPLDGSATGEAPKRAQGSKKTKPAPPSSSSDADDEAASFPEAGPSLHKKPRFDAPAPSFAPPTHSDTSARHEQSFPSELLAFLTSFLPAHAEHVLRHLCTILLFAGVTSVEDLALLVVETNEGSQKHLIEELEKKGTDRATCEMLFEVLLEAKKQLCGSGVAGRREGAA
ncbi:hypothetical protein JCM10213_002428 [Rhodosporidiobolus nylandii]